MKRKDFEKSMEVILGNLRNASHASKELLKNSKADLADSQKTMLIEPLVFYQMQTIVDEYQKFSEIAAMVSKQFKDFKNEIEDKGEKQEC